MFLAPAAKLTIPTLWFLLVSLLTRLWLVTIPPVKMGLSLTSRSGTSPFLITSISPPYPADSVQSADVKTTQPG